MSRVVAIASQKGGVGKTTTAINLAAAFGMGGRRCLVIDLDPQANATTGLGVEVQSGRGLADVLMNPSKLSSTLVRDVATGVDLLPSGGPIRRVEILLAQRGPGNLFNDILRQINKDYYRILIDCPPSLGPLTLGAVGAAHSVLVPVQCEFYAMQGLAQVMSVVERLRQSMGIKIEIEGIILTMFDTAQPMGREVISEVRSFFREKVCATVIPRDPALAEAPSHGRTILDYDLRSRGARAYIQLAKEMMRRG